VTRYNVRVHRSVEKALNGLDAALKKKLIEVIDSLGDYPISLRRMDVVKMRGRGNTFRVREGDYKQIFYVDKAEGVVYVTVLEHRGRVYKKT
jgi:mRNA interferase RelE/StbE